MESKLKHLELIQSVINRMAGNSFLLKGWSVTLVSALFALAAKDSNSLFLFVAYFPCICFWVLDAYFLRQERLYRKLYSNVCDKDENEIDFSMDASVFSTSVQSWGGTAFSNTLSLFYGTVFFTVLVVTIIAIIGS
ncbi:MAG: hypothetical protein ISR72_10610 [Methylobacter sp.]|nr:hypothetical protein [Methylobacter sp.]